MNNEIKGNYSERRCECGNIFYVPVGRIGQMKLKKTRPRNCVTCSPKCAKIYSYPYKKKNTASKMDNANLGGKDEK